MSQYVVYFDIGAGADDVPGEIMLTKVFPDSAGSTEFAAAAPDDSDWLIDPDAAADTDTHYVDDPTGTPTLDDRPVIFDTPDYQIYPNGTEEVSFTLPAGTTVYYHLSSSKTVYASSEAFSFKTAIDGEWIWDIDPPFPYRGLQLRIYTDADI